MTNQQFEDRMNRLKQGYDQLPDRSSPEKIMQYVQKHSIKKKGYKPQWLYAASILLVIAIGSILSINQLTGTNEISSENGAEMARIAKVEEIPPAEHQPEMFSVPDTEQEEQAMMESNVIDQPDRPETMTKSILIEGMEEQEDYSLYVDSTFRFSTYLPTEFSTEQVGTEEGISTYIYPIFNGVQMDNTFIQFFESADAAFSVEQLLTEQKQKWVDQGIEYNELDESERRKIAKMQFLFHNPENGYVGELLIIEHEQRTFVVTIQYPVEMGDGLSPRLAVLFEELEWY